MLVDTESTEKITYHLQPALYPWSTSFPEALYSIMQNAETQSFLEVLIGLEISDLNGQMISK